MIRVVLLPWLFLQCHNPHSDARPEGSGSRALAAEPPNAVTPLASSPATPVPGMPASSQPTPPPVEPRVVRFVWRPPGADRAAYAMPDPADQHQMVLVGIDERRAGQYPIVIALHGQPRRGQAPRSYAFAPSAIAAARASYDRGDVGPFVLVLPVFRFAGVDWPAFDLVAFRQRIEQLLSNEHLRAGQYYVIGHSGAAGCGGDGLNRAHRIHPAAVGFIDTCVGAGWQNEVRALREAKIRTLIVHSVETAGYRPRPPHEYSTDFDFGKVDGPVGLAPVACPAQFPAARLRPQPFRCAADAQGITRSFVIDSGSGQTGHDAAVPLGLEYFLKEYVGR